LPGRWRSWDSRLDKYFIIQDHPYYKLGGVFDFSILRTEKKYNDRQEEITFFIVEDISKNELNVRSFIWQLKDNWEKKTLKCQVIGYRKNGLNLLNVDFSHPVYNIGKIFEFEIAGYGSYLDKNMNNIPSVIVRAFDNNEIHVIAFKWQNENLWTFPTLPTRASRRFPGSPGMSGQASRPGYPYSRPLPLPHSPTLNKKTAFSRFFC